MEFRCATAPENLGEKMVMRFLNSNTDAEPRYPDFKRDSTTRFQINHQRGQRNHHRFRANRVKASRQHWHRPYEKKTAVS